MNVLGLIYSYSYSYSFSLGKSAQAGKGAMRLALYEAPTRETRPDHYTGNSVPYLYYVATTSYCCYVIFLLFLLCFSASSSYHFAPKTLELEKKLI